MKPADLTRAQFESALAKHGITTIPGRTHGMTFRLPDGDTSYYGGHYYKTQRRLILAELIKRKEQRERARELEAARKSLQEAGADVVREALEAIESPSDDLGCCGEFATGSGQHGENCTPSDRLRYAVERCRAAQREYVRLGGARATKEARERANANAMRELNALVSEVLGS